MASHWIPEDDFRLRKSIENGASLESLAKGAVRFSRKFTLLELTDRWHSLLYNPQVTSSSSSIGFDLQYSDQFLPENHHHTTQVRSEYYKARKRMRLEEPLNHHDDQQHLNQLGTDDAFGQNEFGGFGFLEDLGLFDGTDIDNFHNTFPDILQDTNGFDQSNNDDEDDQMVNQLLNMDDGQIQGFQVTNETEQVLLQEQFQDLLLQQPNESHHQEAETWIAPEQYCRQNEAKLVSQLDPHPEIINGVINCVLNKESDEIPDNDDFIPQLHNPKARNSVNPSSSRRRPMEPHLPPIRASLLSQQAKGNNDMVQSYGIGDCSSSSSAFKDSFTEKAMTSTVVGTTLTLLQQDSLEYDIFEENNNNEIESDEDLPCYSDVEAMVLDMDLEPTGQDRYELEALRCRNEEMGRMIMRLEQSSKSYINREIVSHGAFALLSGSSKHYINKKEVLLGRATGEYPIDIDLARSGSGTKVSRRQAIIRMKQDGSFEIKNLGKFSIWMNDQGEVVNLNNQCLIKIREMSFIFSINEKAVKRFLDEIHK